jgi:putative oxidoreductase
MIGKETPMFETLVSLRRLVLDVTGRLRFLPPLLARIAVGVVFVSTGWGKLHALDQIVDYFRQLGIPAPELQAPFVATVELVGGSMILLGLGARLAAVPLMGTMVVALITAILPDAEGAIDLLGKVEVLYLILFTWIAIAGPGAVSVDALIARRLDAERAPLRAARGRTVVA